MQTLLVVYRHVLGQMEKEYVPCMCASPKQKGCNRHHACRILGWIQDRGSDIKKVENLLRDFHLDLDSGSRDFGSYELQDFGIQND